MKFLNLILQGTKQGREGYREDLSEQTEDIQLKASDQVLILPFTSCVTLDK